MDLAQILHRLCVRRTTKKPQLKMKKTTKSEIAFCAYMTFVLFYFQLSLISSLAPHHDCPSNHLLKSLVYHEDHSKIDCYCTYDPSHEREGGGWDITCLKQLRSSSSKQVNITSNPETVIKNIKPMSDDDDVSSDLHYSTLETNAFEFTIKHESRRSIEIACYDSSPDFKPAMFQGKSFSFVANFPSNRVKHFRPLNKTHLFSPTIHFH